MKLGDKWWNNTWWKRLIIVLTFPLWICLFIVAIPIAAVAWIVICIIDYIMTGNPI